MKQTILVTGASSGFGAMTARALARGGHRVYASMRDPAARGGVAAAEMTHLAEDNAGHIVFGPAESFTREQLAA